MWSKNKSIQIIWALLLIQLVAAGTTRQGRRAEDAAYPNANGDVDADGFHTFTRQGVTLRIQPRTRTIRIDGRNASPAQLLEQAKQARQLELLAVRQLLNTRHPVKRTSFENGRKQTSTYTLEPDGSIVCKIVDDIDMADVDRRFEEIFQKQREKQAKEQPNKIADWEWSEDNDEPAQRPIYRAPLQPYPAGQPYVPTPPQSPQPAEQQPTFYQPPRFQPAWPMRDQDDPFNPHGLPAMNSFDDDEEDLFDAYDKAYPSPVGPTNTVSNTNTDKDGNVVHTTLTTGPNEWKRKTVKTPTNTQTRPVEEPSTTVRNIPNLDDFLREQYNPSPKAKPESVTPSTTTSTTPKIIKTINVQDLPPIALLNPNKQLDEEFLQPLTPNADGEQPRPIKTLRVDNIPPSSVPDMDTDRYEQRKVQTLTKTIHGNQMPTAADLDPKMLDMLQRAGITPEDIANANGQTITKTRVEPDGRTVTTTYRINRGNTIAPSSFDAPNGGATYPEDTNNWRPYGVPSVFRVPLPPKHQSASHFGVDFTPFSAGSVAAAVTTTTTTRPLVRDREPLEPQDEDNENSVTLNPLLIHPVQPVVTKTLAPSDPNLIRVRSPIAEFLVKCGLSVPDLRANKGEYVRTFLDPDGSVLTARFILTGPIMYPVLNY